MAVDPSACIGCQLVPAPHSSVAVRNRQRCDGARLPRATWNKWKGPAPAQCSEAGVGSGPFMPRKALATGPAALRFAPEAAGERRGAQMSERRGGPGRAQARAADRARPRGRAGLRRISDENHRRIAPDGYVEFKPTWQSIMGELRLPCGCAPQGARSAAVGRQHDRQSNDLSPGYGCSDGAGGNFSLTADCSVFAGNTGIEYVTDNVGLPRHRVS